MLGQKGWPSIEAVAVVWALASPEDAFLMVILTSTPSSQSGEEEEALSSPLSLSEALCRQGRVPGFRSTQLHAKRTSQGAESAQRAQRLRSGCAAAPLLGSGAPSDGKVSRAARLHLLDREPREQREQRHAQRFFFGKGPLPPRARGRSAPKLRAPQSLRRAAPQTQRAHVARIGPSKLL